jgi:hypothetical protein
MMKKLKIIVIIFFFFSSGYAKDLKAGQKYKIVKPVYLMGVYDSLNNKTLSKSTARAYLHAQELYKKSYVAFQTEVPIGTVMTIISPAPKPWYLYFYADQYFVKLEPDLSQGLEIKFQLDRGMEGNLDGLNPEIFSRMGE